MPKISHFRWVIISLIFFITITNYIDRASISYAIDDIQTLFGLDDNKVGLILGAFGIGYAITTFLGGIAVDRYGAKKTLFISVLLWSFAVIFSGVSTGFIMIFLMRALLGIAEGPNFPGTTRAVSDWLPENERSRALSLSLIAVPIALAIGGPIVSQLIIHTTWRGMFFILGAIGLFWLPLWLCFFKDFPEQSKHVSPQELALINENNTQDNFDAEKILNSRQHTKGLWKFLFTNKTLLSNYWAFFVFGYFLFFFMSWLPSFLETKYHMQIAQVGLFTVLPWALGALLLWLCGQLSDSIFKKTKSLRFSRSYIIIFTQLIAALSVFFIANASSKTSAIIYISLAIGFIMAGNAAYYAVNIDIIKQRSGTALGIMDACFALAGFLAPVLTGHIIQLTHHYHSAFIVLAVLALSSVLFAFLFHHPDKDKQE